MMRFLSYDDTVALMDWPSLIAAMRQAYGAQYRRAMDPGRLIARGTGSVLRTMTAASPSGNYMGAKLFAVSNSTPQVRQLVITLFDQRTGLLAGLMDARAITMFRTAATSAVAIDTMVRRSEITVAILGSGHEARSHVAATACVRPIKRLAVYSPTPANRERFASDMSAELGVECVAAPTPEEAVANADLILATARSKDETPILSAEWCAPQSTVISIGSTLPEQREVGPDLLARAGMMVCDMVDEVMSETGDLIAARAAGIDMSGSTIALSDWVRRREAGEPIPDHDLLLFKSVGSGLQDIVAAEMVLERALASDTGVALDLDIGVSIRDGATNKSGEKAPSR